MLKHAKNFNEWKEKIVRIEDDSFYSTFKWKTRAIPWWHVFVFNGFSCKSGENRRRYSVNFQKYILFFSSLEKPAPLKGRDLAKIFQ